MTERNFDEQKKWNFVIIYNFVIKASSVVVFNINMLANITLMGKVPTNIIKVKNYQNSLWTSIECAMKFRMITQLWNTNTPVIVSRDA